MQGNNKQQQQKSNSIDTASISKIISRYTLQFLLDIFNVGLLI